MSTKTLRHVTSADFSQVASILNYYVEHTIITFRTNQVDDKTISATYSEAKKQDLPFFVVVENERVLGYVYALGFRSDRPAYRHTVEISIYVHPEYRGHGIGTQLMKGLFEALKARERENNSNMTTVNRDSPPERKIQQVLAVMAYDVNGTSLKECQNLRDWYIGFGFEQVGQLKRIGWKFGRWIDVIIMQASLE